jgi:hypothetical protein
VTGECLGRIESAVDDVDEHLDGAIGISRVGGQEDLVEQTFGVPKS